MWTDLISVVDVGVRQTSCHQLKQDYSVSVDIGLERIRVAVLHSNDFRSLKEKEVRYVKVT